MPVGFVRVVEKGSLSSTFTAHKMKFPRYITIGVCVMIAWVGFRFNFIFWGGGRRGGHFVVPQQSVARTLLVRLSSILLNRRG